MRKKTTRRTKKWRTRECKSGTMTTTGKAKEEPHEREDACMERTVEMRENINTQQATDTDHGHQAYWIHLLSLLALRTSRCHAHNDFSFASCSIVKHMMSVRFCRKIRTKWRIRCDAILWSGTIRYYVKKKKERKGENKSWIHRETKERENEVIRTLLI